jgi:oligoribonuclease NrnB/cAMP/cGMP phosphodiesterase (DHH superfamily)
MWEELKSTFLGVMPLRLLWLNEVRLKAETGPIDPHSINFVIYHGDCSDGFGACWAAHKLLGNKATYFAGRYGDNPPDVTGKNVAILDFSYDRRTTKRMVKQASSLVILDHHKTAFERLGNMPELHFDNSHSGAILSWNFFHPNKEPPHFIKYIEDRDLWKWKLPYSKEFSAAFDMVPFDFFEFEKFEDDSVVSDAINRGKYILAYSKTVIKKVADNASERKWRNKKVMVVNSSHWMSEIGHRLAPDCDFVVIWYYDHKRHRTKVSLRAFHDEIDVSKIAQIYGGGGHKQSAGFELPDGTHVETIFDKEQNAA